MDIARTLAIILNIALAYLVYPTIILLQYAYNNMFLGQLDISRAHFILFYTACFFPFLLIISIIASALALLNKRNQRAAFWSILPIVCFVVLLIILAFLA